MLQKVRDYWKKSKEQVTNMTKLWKKWTKWQNQISKVITKSKYLDQGAGDGLQPNHYHCVEIHQSAAQFD